MTRKYKRIFLSALIIATPAFAARAILRPGTYRPIKEVSSQAIDGAYRDGVYQGKLAAERGSKPHANVARWYSEQDRATYAAGYQQGYQDQLTSRK